jgi:hypothetical protein
VSRCQAVCQEVCLQQSMTVNKQASEAVYVCAFPPYSHGPYESTPLPVSSTSQEPNNREWGPTAADGRPCVCRSGFGNRYTQPYGPGASFRLSEETVWFECLSTRVRVAHRTDINEFILMDEYYPSRNTGISVPSR